MGILTSTHIYTSHTHTHTHALSTHTCNREDKLTKLTHLLAGCSNDKRVLQHSQEEVYLEPFLVTSSGRSSRKTQQRAAQRSEPRYRTTWLRRSRYTILTYIHEFNRHFSRGDRCNKIAERWSHADVRVATTMYLFSL